VHHDLKSPSFTGLLVAAIILILWIISLAFCLLVTIDQSTIGWILLGILSRTFIQTGLFILAHDAIHGSVLPGQRQWNDSIGRLAVTLYAFLSYQKLSINHWQHHRYPGQAKDPDFYDGFDGNIFVWYLKFMQGYLNLQQIVVQFFGLGMVFVVFYFGYHISIINLALFWVLPIFLSTIQLFFFGTYLPHRPHNIENRHHATSSYYPPIISFFTCYHFGYHWEHHEYPSLPWYSLPAVRQHIQQSNTKISNSDRSVIQLIIKSPLLALLLLTVD
jgi:beta-carotene/zeaxanthin 4-ketolase